MGAARKKAEEVWYNPHPPTSREGIQARLENKALRLIEQRLDDGTASSQETTLFARSASTRGKIEELRLQAEVDLMKAKKSHLESQEQLQNMFREALQAMGGYRFEEASHEPPIHGVD